MGATPPTGFGRGRMLAAHVRDEARRPLARWSVLAAGGYVFGLGSAQISGLAHAIEGQTQPWQFVLLGFGVAAYIVGLAGLVATGWRTARG